ncbi:MAG TPA: transcriptional regulator, partial [Microvirga sp.]|nr:transcriptional regulator [Microvirga sp.]
MLYRFEDCSLDVGRRELRRGRDLVAVEPLAFDLLEFLIRNRHRIVGKDDLIGEVWKRRIVSDSALSSRMTAVRHAVGDDAGEQRLIRTVPRRGFRFIGDVREEVEPDQGRDRPVASGGPPAAAGEDTPSRIADTPG